MGDEWDDTYVPDTGKAFGRGKPVNDNVGDDEWNDFGTGNSNGFGGNDDNGWGSSNNDRPPRGGGRGGGRGGDRRGGRGGRGGGGRRDNGFNNDGDGDDFNSGGNSWGNGDDDEGGRGRRGGGRGGRGGRGGGRGGGHGGDEDFSAGGENGESDKPVVEKYIPPEPTEDENEIFTSGNSTGLNFDKFDDIEVKVSGENVPPKVTSFEDSGLRPFLIRNVTKSGYTKPTPIQKHALPIIMDGRDVMGCAQTGSGKTAAFLLPILHKLLEDPQEAIVQDGHCEPQAIIVAPTRELIKQIHDECRKFAHGSDIKVVEAYGGADSYTQKQRLFRGCHVLVATPGRLMDFIGKGKVTCNSIRFVVLDEADRMLDMGFLPEMEKLMKHETMVTEGERQTLMFSATFPEEIQRLAGQFLHNYVFITVGVIGGACADVTQTFYQVDKFKKRDKLLEILQEQGSERTLVFVETKRNADFLASYLCESDFKTTSIHGDRLQREREEALADFKHGRRNILVATGVAARGLDIKNVQHVINYDLPKGIDEYVHRIGRTGRVGNSGRASSFYDSSSDASLAKDLIKILTDCKQPIPDWLLRDQSAGGGGGGFRRSKFGGQDVRDDDFGSSNNDNSSAAPVCDEEDW